MSDQTFYRIAPPTNLIFRDEGGEATVEGMVVPYDEWVEIDNILEGHFIERFAPGSLRKTFSEGMSRMKGRFEHGRSKLFEANPVMEIKETWDTAKGAFFRASLLNGLPEWMVDGMRRGLYGASIGAEPIVMERTRRPRPHDLNPNGIEERTYKELRAYEISLTTAPQYESAQIVLRSITDELALAALVREPERLLQLMRSTQEAEPTHSEPEEPEAPVEPEVEEPETPQEPEPEPEGSRATPSVDYLADREEEEWRL